jgi:pyruvate/2-oxoglutarate dehydrogenase complex dihydrolipoamide acyltransferase (E2) component
MMIRPVLLSLALVLAAGSEASAASTFAPAPKAAAALPVEPARSALRKFFDALGDDDVHDDHYDWNDYRDATSRKDRIRDYQRMQLDAQRDYWRHQKEAQKQAIKAQRGW